MLSTTTLGGMMRRLLKAACATVLSAALVSAGTPPADPVMGLVAESKNCNVVSGTTLFEKTEIWTAVNGMATLLMNNSSATLLLTSDSKIWLLTPKDSSIARLEQGTLRFASRQPVSLQVFWDSVQIRPQGNGISSGEIRILGKNRIAVVAGDAPILVSANGDSVLVPKGYEYTLEVAEPMDQGPPPMGAGAENYRKRKGVIIIGVSAALATLTVGLLLSATQSTRGAFASPFFP
jgi:hypothetical protein